jgi:hypothetical protein
MCMQPAPTYSAWHNFEHNVCVMCLLLLAHNTLTSCRATLDPSPSLNPPHPQVTREELDAAAAAVAPFGCDNRAGIAGTLHRISALRSRQGNVVGLTCRVGRAVSGHVDMINDILEGAAQDKCSMRRIPAGLHAVVYGWTGAVCCHDDRTTCTPYVPTAIARQPWHPSLCPHLTAQHIANRC